MTIQTPVNLAKIDAGLLEELGQTGLKRSSGLIFEEFLNQVRGERGRQIFQQMEYNDPVIAAMLYALEMLMRGVTWTVEPFDESSEATQDGKFVDEVIEDQSHSWGSFIGEWMAAPVYGFAPFEIIWKKRQGFNRDPDKTSKFNDGKLGIARLAIRHPTSFVRWVYDKNNKLTGMVQRSPPSFKTVELPSEKMLFFTVLQRKGNPEGTSLLRRAFTAYWRKKGIENIESIGIERELVGMPFFKTPPEWWLPTASDEDKAMLAQMKKIVRRLKSDEQNGIVIPNIIDKETGEPLLTFELLNTGGRRAIDTGPPKEYYSRQMAMTILADVILLGHEKVGSFALASSKTNLFAAGLGGMLDDMEETFNNDLIPRLMILNGRDPAQAPKLRHGDVETQDLGVIGDFIEKLSGAGMHLFPTEDGELERALLLAGDLPLGPADMAPQLFQEQGEMRTATLDSLASVNTNGNTGHEDEDDE